MPNTEEPKKLSNLRNTQEVLLVWVLEGNGTDEYPYLQVGYIMAKDGSVLGRLDRDWIYTNDLFKQFGGGTKN